MKQKENINFAYIIKIKNMKKYYFYLFVSNPFDDEYHALIVPAENLQQLRKRGYKLLYLKGRYRSANLAIAACDIYPNCQLISISNDTPIQLTLF